MKDKALSGLQADKLQKNFWTYGILLAALGAMTFFGVCDPSGRKYGQKGSAGSVAATVGSDTISSMEFERAYQQEYQQYQRMYQDAFDPSQLKLAHSVMTRLIDEHALYNKAAELGLRASEDEVLAMLVQQGAFKGEDGKFSDEQMKRYLDSNGYTEATFMDYMRRMVTLQKLREFFSQTAYVSSKAAELDYKVAETKLDLDYLKFDPQKIDVQVSKEDIDKFLADPASKARVKEYYETNSREFNRPEEVKARHILVSFKGARNATADGAKRDKDAARKRADELLAKVKAPGADFAKIAKESTDEDAGKKSGGDLGFFTRETMDKAFSDAAFALNKGDISAVTESPFGFHIIKVEDKKAAVKTTLEEAQRKIAETLISKEKRPTLAKAEATQALNDLLAKKPVDAQLAKDKIVWATTGAFGADGRYVPGIGNSKELSEALGKLTAPGQLFGTVLDVRGNLFVLRLKSRVEPDLTKLDADRRRELAQSAEYSEGNGLYTAFEKSVRDEVEKKQLSTENPYYLARDEPKAKDAGG